MSKRRKYSPEFKHGAVEQTRQPGVSCAQIAHELGIAPSLLTRWRREADSADQKAFSGTGSPRDEEVPPANDFEDSGRTSKRHQENKLIFERNIDILKRLGND